MWLKSYRKTRVFDVFRTKTPETFMLSSKEAPEFCWNPGLKVWFTFCCLVVFPIMHCVQTLTFPAQTSHFHTSLTNTVPLNESDFLTRVRRRLRPPLNQGHAHLLLLKRFLLAARG